MKIKLKLFGHFREYLHGRGEKFCFWAEVDEGFSVSQVLSSLGIQEGESIAIIRNYHACDKSQLLSEGDVIAVFPPISGG